MLRPRGAGRGSCGRAPDVARTPAGERWRRAVAERRSRREVAIPERPPRPPRRSPHPDRQGQGRRAALRRPACPSRETNRTPHASRPASRSGPRVTRRPPRGANGHREAAAPVTTTGRTVRTAGLAVDTAGCLDPRLTVGCGGVCAGRDAAEAVAAIGGAAAWSVEPGLRCGVEESRPPAEPARAARRRSLRRGSGASHGRDWRPGQQRRQQERLPTGATEREAPSRPVRGNGRRDDRRRSDRRRRRRRGNRCAATGGAATGGTVPRRSADGSSGLRPRRALPAPRAQTDRSRGGNLR